MEKMVSEGQWSQGEIMLGFTSNNDAYTIALPAAKIEGARMFVTGDTYPPWSMKVEIEEIHVLRELCHRRLVACFSGEL